MLLDTSYNNISKMFLGQEEIETISCVGVIDINQK